MLLTILGVGCSRQDTANVDQSELTDSADRPDSEISSGIIYLYERGRVTSKVIAERILQYDAIDSTMAYAIIVETYDTLNRVISVLVGDSGLICEKKGTLSVYGHVVVITEDSTKLETDSLFWNSATDKILTDEFVKITQGNDIMTGYGLEANQNLTHIKILRDISGEITDPEKLEEKTDE